MQTSRVLEISHKLDLSDIDWDLAADVGLTDEERFIITYFSDIEAQTIIYMRDLLHTTAIDDPSVIGFLSAWNYEEYFHGEALAKLLEVCGEPLAENRIGQVRRKATLGERFLAWATSKVSRLLNDRFVTLYMTWGAVQEFTTHAGYQRIRETTKNPVLNEIVKRIIKQERVHFAWYFNNAKRRLEENPTHQKIVRFMLERFWSPVGAGVKTDKEVTQLFTNLFGVGYSDKLISGVDGKIGELPGMQGIQIMDSWFSGNVQPLLAKA